MPLWLDDFLWAYSSFIYGLGVNAILGLSMYAVLALGQLSLGQAAFMGLGLVEQHRMVYAALGDLMPRIHALQLRTSAEGESAR